MSSPPERPEPREAPQPRAANERWQAATRAAEATGTAGAFRSGSPDRLDHGLHNALQTIAELARADRALVASLTDPGGQEWIVTDEWYAPGLEAGAYPVADTAGATVAWTRAVLASDRGLRVKSRESLPAGFERERALLEHLGLESLLALPVLADRALVGVVAFGAARKNHLWPDEVLTLSRLINDILAGVWERQRIDRHVRRRNEFDRHVATLSTRLINLAPEGIDAAVEEALADTSRIAGIDRALVYQLRDDARVARITHACGLAPSHPAWEQVSEIPLGRFPDWQRAFRDGHAVHIPDVGSADSADTPELQLLTGRNVLSFAAMPMNFSGTSIGFVAFSSIHSTRRWDEQELSLLRVFTEIVTNALVRQRAAEDERYHNEFGRLVATMSARFANVPAARIDEAIRESLTEVGQFTGVDHCGAFSINEDATRVRCTHDGAPTARAFHDIDATEYPWWSEQLKLGRVVHMFDAESLPESAVNEKALLAGSDIRTVVCVPMLVEGKPRGTVNFTSVGTSKRWTDSGKRIALAFAGIIANALEWKRAEEQRLALISELEDRVAERTAQLEASNKDLEAFSYSISHDLRTPLRSIESFGEILLEDHATELAEEAHELIRRVCRSSRRLGEMVDALLEFSRVARTDVVWEPIDLSALAKDVTAGFRACEPERAVSVRIEDGLVARGTGPLVYALLENVIGNAWKFTRTRQQALIEVGTADIDGHPTYFVRDDGIGFDVERAAILFDPFQRLQAAAEFEGHGIGLATVRRIVEMHGGSVWATGELDRGATVFFRLGHEPASDAPIAEGP